MEILETTTVKIGLPLDEVEILLDRLGIPVENMAVLEGDNGKLVLEITHEPVL